MSKFVKMDTSAGTLRIELDDEKAPLSTANFLAYVHKGHYDGTVFHRVIKGFMIQGGGFEPGMKQKPTDAPIRNEASNGLKNKRHTLAMARTQRPHSASAQFFRQHRRQRLHSTSAPRMPRVGAMRYSAASWRVPRCWTRSRTCAPAARASTTTCRWKTCASSGPSR